MIYIDNRIGSKDLLPLLPKNAAELTHLDYGDAAFLGRGVDDAPISVGIERKRLNDFLTSMTSGRLSGHQLPGLLSSYDIVYLVLEGLWRACPTNGILEAPKSHGWRPVQLGARTFMAKEIWSYLNTMQILAGVYVWQSGTARATAQWITNLYHWYNSKPIDAHKSHTAPHIAHAQLSTKKPSLVRRVAAELPGVGFGKSKAVAARFSTLLELVMADTATWREIDGIGKTLANRITKEIHGNDDK
jgi:ERCC4-type nuclease